MPEAVDASATSDDATMPRGWPPLHARPRVCLDRIWLVERDGSSLSASDRAVVAIGGDGEFNVMLGELETARRVGRGLNPRNTQFFNAVGSLT